MVAITEAQCADDYRTCRALIEEYATSLGVDLCFQDLTQELATLHTSYGPPTGCLWLARGDNETVGCVAIRKHTAEACELKRLYVRESFRGAGVGRLLTRAAMARARTLGYARIVLDTLASMEAAKGLYRSLGFRPTEAYYVNPLPGVEYMALDLPRV